MSRTLRYVTNPNRKSAHNPLRACPTYQHPVAVFGTAYYDGSWTQPRPAAAPDPHRPPPVSAAVRRDVLGDFAAMLLLAPVEAGAVKAAELDGELLACCAVLAHRALEQRAHRALDPARVGAREIGPGDQRLHLPRHPGVAGQRRAAPLPRAPVRASHPGARHADLRRVEAASFPARAALSD